MSKISDEIRRDWKAGDAIRDAGLTTPDSVKRFDDIYYGDDKKWQVFYIFVQIKMVQYHLYQNLPFLV